MSNITEKDIVESLEELNSFFPNVELKFGHKYEYYILTWRYKSDNHGITRGSPIATGTKREIYSAIGYMFQGIEFKAKEEL